MTRFGLLRTAFADLAVVGLMVVMALAGSVAFGAAQDADGLNLDAHPGPAVWVEEHWDVKPGELDNFYRSYDRELYSLIRRTPGYRGYLVLERMELDYPHIDDKFIWFHPSIQLLGRIPTERQVNWDYLIRPAYNVRVIHFFATWADADQWQDRIARVYAGDHPGLHLEDRLASTVYSLANNYWSATYRLLKTGWPASAAAGRRLPTDADGLSFNSRSGPGAPYDIIGEHWDVQPERLHDFLEMYEHDVYSWLRRGHGYRGYSIATSLPPQAWESDAPRMSPADVARLGGEDSIYVRSPGVMMDGSIRTDVSINVGALYKKTFNVIVLHAQTRNATWFSEVNAAYAEAHNGANFHESWKDTLMTTSNNHWDNNFLIMRNSFVPDAAPPPAR